MGQYLGGIQLGRVESEFVDTTEVRVSPRPAGVVVRSKRQCHITVGSVCHVARIRSAGATRPYIGVGSDPVDVNGQTGVRYGINRIVNHHHVRPLPNLVRNTTDYIQTAAAAAAAIHSAVPAYP